MKASEDFRDEQLQAAQTEGLKDDLEELLEEPNIDMSKCPYEN